MGAEGSGGGIDEAVVNMPLIAIVHIPAEIPPVHGTMVTGDDDGGIFVERLGHDPLHKGVYLPGRAGDGVFVAFFVIAAAKTAAVQNSHW